MLVGRLPELLARKLASLPERAMHWRVLLETLREGSVEDAARLAETILTRPMGADRRPDLLRLRFLEVLGGASASPKDALDYAFRRDLYAAAHLQGADALKRHLHSLPELADEGVLARRLPKDVAEIPLGRRRSLAKGEDRVLLEKLALDPDPVVLEHLLQNPRTREMDVVRIAALRPVGGESLRRIDADKRWQMNLRVRIAITRNPYCPIDLAMRLLPTLGTRILREINDDSGLAWPVREAIVIELEARTFAERGAEDRGSLDD
jgi:hypothetical protein